MNEASGSGRGMGTQLRAYRLRLVESRVHIAHVAGGSVLA